MPHLATDTRPSSPAIVFTFPGIGVQHPGIRVQHPRNRCSSSRNSCSRSPGIRVQDRPEYALEVWIETEIPKTCLKRRENEAIAWPLARVKYYLQGQYFAALRERPDAVLGLDRRDLLDSRKMPGACRILSPARGTSFASLWKEDRLPATNNSVVTASSGSLPAALVGANPACPAADCSKTAGP